MSEKDLKIISEAECMIAVVAVCLLLAFLVDYFLDR